MHNPIHSLTLPSALELSKIEIHAKSGHMGPYSAQFAGLLALIRKQEAALQAATTQEIRAVAEFEGYIDGVEPKFRMLGNLAVGAKLYAAPASSPEIPDSSVTVDTLEFQKLLATLVEAEDYGCDEYVAARAPFIAHIDAHTSAAVARAVADIDLQSIEQYRMQMAGISTAALGYWTEDESIMPEYDTPALRDVAKLYAKYAALHAQAAPVAASQSNPQASTYPREIWLQAGECSPDEALPYNSGLEITWCFESIDRMDVRYVRADLAQIQQPAAEPSQPPAGELPVLPDLFAEFCEREGYPSDGPFDAALRKAFDAGCQQGRAAGIEEAAKVCDNADKSAHPSDLADAIQAIKTTGAA